MRRPLLLACALVLALPASAEAGVQRYLVAGAATLSLRDGHGEATIAARGAMLGRVSRGRLVVTLVRGDPDVAVRGAAATRAVTPNKTVYRGRRLRFRVFGGGWRVRVVGRAIDASAAGRGTFALGGTEGTFSLDGGAYRPWPDELTAFRLGD